MGIYFNNYVNVITIQPVNSVARIEKTRKEQDEKNKKKKIYQAKEKRNPSSASNPEDFLPLEETLFDQSI